MQLIVGVVALSLAVVSPLGAARMLLGGIVTLLAHDRPNGSRSNTDSPTL